MGYLWNSKKSKSMGLPLALWAGVLGLVVVNVTDVPAIALAGYFVMMGLVVGGHMIAYGLSDMAGILKDTLKK